MATAASNAARAGGAALVLACVFSLLAINERASRSPAAVLAQQGPVNVWQQIGAPEPGLAAQQLMKQNDNFGYKANVQMLADIRGSGEKRRAARTANVVALPSAGDFGTDRAFLNKHDGKGMGHVSRLSGFGTDQAFLHMGDGAGQSTKGKTQQLYEWKGAQMGLDHGVMDNVLPDPDKHVWAKPSVPVDPNEYQKEWLGDVINIY